MIETKQRFLLKQKILTETTNDRNRKIENELEISKTNEKESMKLVDVEIKLNSKKSKNERKA